MSELTESVGEKLFVRRAVDFADMIRQMAEDFSEDEGIAIGDVVVAVSGVSDDGALRIKFGVGEVIEDEA